MGYILQFNPETGEHEEVEIPHNSESVELTVSAAEPEKWATVDLGEDNYGVAKVIATFLSVDLDGETLGKNDNEIVFALDSRTTGVSEVPEVDGLTTFGAWLIDRAFGDDEFGIPHDAELPAKSNEGLGLSSRYIHIHGGIVTGYDTTGDYYAGENNPTATWRIDVVYK